MNFRQNRRALQVYIGLCIYMFTVYGFIVYSYGLLISAVSMDGMITLSQMSFTYTLRLLVGSLSTQIGSKLMAKLPSKPYFTVISIGLSMLYLLYSFSSQFWQFLVLAVVAGILLGFSTYLMVPLFCNQWFEAPAQALGIATACAGSGGVVLSPVISRWIADLGWQISMRIIAVCILVILLPVSLFLLQFSPKRLGLSPVPAGRNTGRKKGKKEFTYIPPGKDRIAIFLICSIMFVACGLTLIPALYPSMMESKGIAPCDTGILLSMMQVGNVIAPLLVGLLVSRIGLRRSVVIFLTIGLGGIVLMMLTPGSSFLLLGISGTLFACCRIEGVALPVMCRDFFGTEDYDRIYPRLYLVFYLTTAVTVSLYGVLRDVTGNYFSIYLIIISSIVVIGVMCLVSEMAASRIRNRNS